MQTKYKLNHSLIIFGLMILFFSAAFPLVQAQSVAPGDLDTTFGSGGKVVTAITPNYDFPTRVRIQPDGKIVTVGEAVDFDGLTDLFIVRHNANGSLDTSFGTNGSVVLSFGSSGELFSDFVILPDGKLLVVGGKLNTGTGQYSIALFRYQVNGARDTAFGTNGVVTTPVGSGSLATSVALQADGKLVVAGFTITAQNAVDKPVVVRYNPDGTVDNTFGTNGIVQTTIGNNFPSVSEVLAQTDGKLLVAGTADFSGNTNLFVVRYNADGTLDNTFGASGIVSTDIDNQRNILREMALQPDGKIVVNAGNYNSNGVLQSSAIVRYNANGTLDSAFGTGGIVKITEPQQQNSAGIAVTLAIQQNGKILTAGQRNFTFAISRYNSDGTIDISFGTNGVVITPTNFGDGISSIALQTDGKIVAVGSVNDNLDVGLVRYLGDAVTTAPRTRFDFDGDGKADVSVFRPNDRVWYLNQSTNGFSATQFGLSTDKITPADYDGDGKTDIAVYRNGVWYRINSSTGTVGVVQFGLADDVPVPADYSGNGRAELAVYRNGTWWTFNLANNQTQAIQFGLAADKPVVADYDGDGRADQAVYRNGEWHLNRSSQGYTVVNFGLTADKPVIGDYDGDGKTDQAVYRDGVWYILQSSQGFTAFQFGLSSDIPAPADYDGDGKTDAAIYRDGAWYLRQSTNGISVQQFGLANDKPIPAAFLP